MCTPQQAAVTAQLQEDDHGIRVFFNAVAPAGAWPESRARLGSADPALVGRTRLYRGLDRRAPHRPLGTASRAGPAGCAGAVADQTSSDRSRRLPAAVSPP